MFITDKNEYWNYTNYCLNTAGILFQFHDNNSYDKYLLSHTGFDLFNRDGDLLSESRTWSVKNESTFVLDRGTYHIEKLTKNEILLSYFDSQIKDKKCYVRLSKWIQTANGPKALVIDQLPEVSQNSTDCCANVSDFVPRYRTNPFVWFVN